MEVCSEYFCIAVTNFILVLVRCTIVSTTADTMFTFPLPGTKRQSNQFKCKVFSRPCGRNDSEFFSAENERFRSMTQVARYLNLFAAPIQREKIVMGKLASYLAERGGMC